MDALVDCDAIEYVLGLTEAIVVGMADGYSRWERQPAFVQLHIAAGLGNAIGMLYNAHRGGSALVAYVGQSPDAAAIREPHLHGDLVSMARPVSKWAHELHRPHDIPLAIRRAFKVADTPPQGPVVLSIPTDVLDEMTDAPVQSSTRLDLDNSPAADPLERAAWIVASARSPVILVGDAIADSDEFRSDGSARVVELAEITGAPIYQVYPSMITFDARPPLYRGQLAFTYPGEQLAAFKDADVLICVGSPPERVILGTREYVVPKETWIVQLDRDPWLVAKDHGKTVGLVGSVRLGLDALVVAVRAVQRDGDAEAARARRALIEAAGAIRDSTATPSQAGIGTDAAGIDQGFLARGILSHLSSDSLLFDDAASMSPVIFAMARGLSGRYFKNRGGGLGAGLPGAVGLALASNSERNVVAVVSDGSAMFTIGALWTAAHYKLPVTFLIVNNRGYATLRRNMAAYTRDSARPVIATSLGPPSLDFVSLARGFGVVARRIEHPSELDGALDWAFETEGPRLLDVLVRP